MFVVRLARHYSVIPRNASSIASQAARLSSTNLSAPNPLHRLLRRNVRIASTKTSPDPNTPSPTSSSSASPPPPPPPPSYGWHIRSVLFIGTISIVFTGVGFLIGTVPGAAPILALMTAPTSDDALRIYRTPDEVAAEVEKHMKDHPVAKTLQKDPRWKELRPHLRYPEKHKQHSLTAGALAGPGKFPVPPLIYVDEKNLVELVYVGTDMCGHVGVVHGGLVATILDEGLAWCGFGSLPNRIGMTAYLNINYKKPVPAGSYLVLRAETTKSERRKVWVKGTIQALDKDGKAENEVLVEAEALYIEPKWVKATPKFLLPNMR